MGKHHDWYMSSARHFFRVFYRFEAEGRYPEAPAQQRRHEAVRRILETTPPDDRHFLDLYFTTRYGEDIQFVSDYAAQAGVSQGPLWRIVRTACRRLFVELDLMDHK